MQAAFASVHLHWQFVACVYLYTASRSWRKYPGLQFVCCRPKTCCCSMGCVKMVIVLYIFSFHLLLGGEVQVASVRDRSRWGIVKQLHRCHKESSEKNSEAEGKLCTVEKWLQDLSPHSHFNTLYNCKCKQHKLLETWMHLYPCSGKLINKT